MADMHESWQGLFGRYVNTSFVDLLRQEAPDLLVSRPGAQPVAAPAAEPHGMPGVPTGTTILALRYADGVVVAGDRQATEGYQVAHRRIEKVYKTDEYSAVAIAGAAGPAIEMARLFQTELEHYEKVEGDGLSLEGKANKLGQMIRMNLPMAMQGLVVVPIFAGYDLRRAEGRIFNYDVTGGRYEEDRLRGDRLGRQGRPHHAQEAVPDRGVPRRRAALGGRGARSTRRRRTWGRAAPTSSAGSSRP